MHVLNSIKAAPDVGKDKIAHQAVRDAVALENGQSPVFRSRFGALNKLKAAEAQAAGC